MPTVTVTWMDGQTETYPSVPSFEEGDHWLHLFYDLETYSIPLANVRVWKSETP